METHTDPALARALSEAARLVSYGDDWRSARQSGPLPFSALDVGQSFLVVDVAGVPIPLNGGWGTQWRYRDATDGATGARVNCWRWRNDEANTVEWVWIDPATPVYGLNCVESE